MTQQAKEDPQLKDIDRLIQSLYTGVCDTEWTGFRAYALEQLSRWLGASGAAWITSSRPDMRGEFTEWPAGLGLAREVLAELQFEQGSREREFSPLPAELSPRHAKENGIALIYSHRGGGLTSRVLLRFAANQAIRDSSEIRRAIGHMVEAATLALRHYIERDEWLSTMGRQSRGTAALVDAKGTIYAASKRFRELVGEEFGDTGDNATLPMTLPEVATQAEDGNFSSGSLHFRTSRQGSLYLLHARRPLPMDELSPREQEIARALGNGKTFKSVARQFDIAVSTVANHASRIYKKLGIFRREELVELVRKPTAQEQTTH
ncbi:MAG TPA: helix-turn-helix transcriptional regulator [Solimonas sp.]|nr:helix-turn-helix transcriptional regulator [Solimonas sp.]